jgi:DNA-binding response OmpR family regulator/signal transduction histidine kinase
MESPIRPSRILVVDDEPPIVELVSGYLRREGWQVVAASDGPEALAAARTHAPDVVILDVMLPGIDGIEVCRQLRTFSDAYVLILTARGEEIDRIMGLTVGADDYLVKPFSPREVVARVKALLRRPRAAAARSSGALPDGLEVDEGRRDVRLDGEPVDLTALEFNLLALLAREPGIVVARQAVLDMLWGPEFVGDDHLVDVHIANLRRKLGDDPAAPRFIETVRGVGYRLREARRRAQVAPRPAPGRVPRGDRRRPGHRRALGAAGRPGVLRRGDGSPAGRPDGRGDGRGDARGVHRRGLPGAARGLDHGGRHGAVVSIAVAARITRPISRLAGAARRIADGHYAERVAADEPGELGTLAASFNEMAGSLEATERRRLQLVGDVAHELRTPLTTLEGYLEGLEDGVVAPTPQTWHLLRAETARLTRLVDDLAELWRAEARELSLKVDAVDTAEVAREVGLRFEPQARARAISIAIPDGPVIALADRDRLAQILSNFMSNALRHAPDGSTITIAAAHVGARVDVAVADEGSGLTAEQLESVFERFYRVDTARTRAAGGAGIGLAIVRALAGAMGGWAWAESAGPGRGATFHLELPAP